MSLSFFFSISLRTSPPLFFFYSGSSLLNHRPPRNLSLSWLSMLDVQSGLSLPQHLYIFRLLSSSSKYYFLESDWRAHSTHVQTYSAARRSVVDTKIWRNMDVHTEPAQTPADCAFPTARMDQITLRIPTDTNMHCIYYCIHGPSP